MDAATLTELGATLREVFADAHDGEAVSRTLVSLGWSEAYVDDPAATGALFFEEQGRALGSSGFLDEVLSDLLDIPASDGATPISVALPAPGDRLVLRESSAAAQRIAVVVHRRGSAAAAVFGRDELRIRRVSGIDDHAGLALVEGFDPSDSRFQPTSTWDSALAMARRSLAAELVGVGRAALQLGIVHVSQRTQFGRPIGSFQAVRHRLAECFAELTSAGTLVGEAFASEGHEDCAIAKCVAGQAADRTVRSIIQVSGAIGLTWEHDLHRYVRRAAVLDMLAGEPAALEAELGAALITRSQAS